MISPAVIPPGLVTGERMSVDEFLRRWEELPDLKKAELVDGIVYVPSPLSLEHGSLDSLIIWWLAHYAHATPGCKAGNNSTWLMLVAHRNPMPSCGSCPRTVGSRGRERQFGAGAPELAVEVCVTSTEVDFGPKLKLYERAGVREYITIELFGQRIVWRMLENAVYVAQQVPSDGVLRSQVFPGLWLDVAAFWDDDGAKMLAALNAGLSSEDHQRFVERLRRVPTH